VKTDDSWAEDALIDGVIRALAASDVLELDRLLGIAERIPRRQSELQCVGSKMPLLAALLAETSRNLRLLKRVYGRSGSARPRTVPRMLSR
jgi:hypothetical protein